MKVADNKRNLRVYLTGFMGSGKSTIGPILANTIGYDFVDVDRAIEELAGESVKEIFRLHGEEHFRSLERRLLRELSMREHLVVSLGGGTIADPVSFPIIRESGILVYLKAAPEHLVRRLHHKNDRPMLSDAGGERLDEEMLRQRVHELHARREKFYEMADIVVPTDEQKVGITVDKIVKRLSSFLD